MCYSTSILNHNEDKIIKDEKSVEPADAVSQLNSILQRVKLNPDTVHYRSFSLYLFVVKRPTDLFIQPASDSEGWGSTSTQLVKNFTKNGWTMMLL